MDNQISKLNGIKKDILKQLEVGRLHLPDIQYIQQQEKHIAEIKNVIDYLKTLPTVNTTIEIKSQSFEEIRELFKNGLEDYGLLIGYHSNLACFLEDKCNIEDYATRQELAKDMLKLLFDLDYDWKELIEPENITIEDIEQEESKEESKDE